MNLERSQNARIILDFIIESGPQTLYKIHKEKGMRPSSIHLALKVLSDQNLIELDVEESQRRDRNAKVYTPTFKGLVVFLSDYSLPQHRVRGRGYRLMEQFEDKEESAKKLGEKLKNEWSAYKSEIDKFKEILRRNGELLHYPLFQHCYSLEQLIPGVYQSFIEIAKRILNEPPSTWNILSAKRFRAMKKEIEKNLKMTKKLPGSWVVFQGGKKTPFDPVAFEEQKLDQVKENLRTVFKRENEFLRESLFMYFLMWYRGFRVKLPNRYLYDYTKSLQDKEERRFNSNKQVFSRWLAVFNTS